VFFPSPNPRKTHLVTTSGPFGHRFGHDQDPKKPVKPPRLPTWLPEVARVALKMDQRWAGISTRRKVIFHCIAISIDRGENPKPVKARRQARTALEWLHLPFEEVRSTHLTAFKNARLKQVKPATVNREMDLLSAVIHKAIDSWDYVIAKNPMKGAKRPIYDNGRDRRLEGDEQERLFRSARREDLIRSRDLAIEALLIEPRERAKNARNKSARQRFLKRARHHALKQLRRGYPILPLYESLIAFLLESAPRCSEALALRWRDVDFKDETAFFPVTKNSLSRTVPVQRFTMDLLKLLPRSDERVFPLTVGEFRGAWKRIAERAGLRERDRTNKEKCANDFHRHDLRHESLSRISEVGCARSVSFDVFALQAISGHLDIAYGGLLPSNPECRSNCVGDGQYCVFLTARRVEHPIVADRNCQFRIGIRPTDRAASTRMTNGARTPDGANRYVVTTQPKTSVADG
jgi:integrase